MDVSSETESVTEVPIESYTVLENPVDCTVDGTRVAIYLS